MVNEEKEREIDRIKNELDTLERTAIEPDLTLKDLFAIKQRILKLRKRLNLISKERSTGMAETRTITIESPPENILSVQVEADLVDRFIHTATKKGGSYRSRKESFQDALESAVAVALTKFLEGLEA